MPDEIDQLSCAIRVRQQALIHHPSKVLKEASESLQGGLLHGRRVGAKEGHFRGFVKVVDARDLGIGGKHRGNDRLAWVGGAGWVGGWIFRGDWGGVL